ncbi:LysR family transcriptional regulator [Streptomyces cacaoi]|uniref:LysR family transcriptional regulator n=1 Tax=Streptomyces cacaoi TaxID=1898 RepID=A0A4Y3RCT1_STRCI|nr:LysR family transcriptional regulator [Streptomyces cacaoi]GEB53550.1 LysR family transcriptional regulator [Streptomyces cacaoi]
MTVELESGTRIRALEMRELECFLVLAEELHFGRTAERLYLSQSRVSQLLRSLEGRIGARLVDRTSRRVTLTPLGARFLTGLRPAYGTLADVVDEARAAARCVTGHLRLGFLGSASHRMTAALGLFHERHPQVATSVVEIPMADPFGPVRRAEVDAAVVMLPVCEPDLALGPRFEKQPWRLALAAGHPLVRRGRLDAEDLAAVPLIASAPPAPDYWRDHHAPRRTPSGRTIPRGPLVATLQEGLASAAAGLGGMLLCRPTAEIHVRADLAFVPVTGLPPNELVLVRGKESDTALLRALTAAVADTGCETHTAPDVCP